MKIFEKYQFGNEICNGTVYFNEKQMKKFGHGSVFTYYEKNRNFTISQQVNEITHSISQFKVAFNTQET